MAGWLRQTEYMANDELIPQLFRTEYRKIVAVLCKHLGLRQMQQPRLARIF